MSEATQEQLLQATSPAALAALMGQADAPDSTQQGVIEPTTDAAVDAAKTVTPDNNGATPSASSSEQEATGVATKSGSGVLPFKVLQDERAEKRHWRDQANTLQQRLDQAQAQLESLQRNATQQQQLDALEALTDEEIAAAEGDFPLLAKLARHVRATAAAEPSGQPPAQPAVTAQDAADDRAAAAHAAMADKPLLQRALSTGGVIWARVVELDQSLSTDPTWQGKSLSERAAEVQRTLANELGVSLASTAAPAPPAAPHVEPFKPHTTTDLIGGASPDGSDGISANANGMALARRFASMSPEQMQAAIRRSV